MANITGKGGFKKGVSGNAAGKPSGHQNFIDRAKYLLDQHNIASIKEFITNEKKFDQLSVYDAMIMRRIAEAVAENGGQSMDRLLDRLLGKPPQHITQDLNASIENRPVSETIEWLEASLGNKAAKPPQKPV